MCGKPDDPGAVTAPTCRFCGTALKYTFVDLGMHPLCNNYLTPEQARRAEVFYPLHARVCGECFLVQLETFAAPQDIFSDYAYFSSYSDSWVRHAKTYAEMAVKRFGLGVGSLVVELASNDGYLLQHFKAAGIPCLGIEPAANVAEAANAKGIPTRVKFFGVATATELVDEGKRADLIVGNNVLAHVPDLNDFVAGMATLLAPGGVITMEFPHLARLMAENQFDTIYHEHFSYFSFHTVERVFAQHGLTLFDVDELTTHGGSLRIYGRHTGNAALEVQPAVAALKAAEAEAHLTTLDGYAGFAEQVKQIKCEILRFLIDAKTAGRTIVGYGAPGKGNTLLNYCGIGTEFLDYTVDRSPWKQGRFLPGSHIPVYAPDRIARTRPDYVFILPWNLKAEIIGQMPMRREWGGKFVVPIPHVEVC